MISFEEAFGDTERAADSTLKSATDLTKQARALRKAAQTGNIAAIKRAQGGIHEALSILAQDVENASSSWPFRDEEEKQYLDDHYVAEFCRTAEDVGLRIFERDGNLISYPSIVRILPGDQAVRVDSKRVATIRPSHLVSTLLKNQQKPLRRLPMAYLNALYSVYSDIVSGESSGRMVKGSGRVVPLARVYRLLTSLPGSRREYRPNGDFARDLYILDSDDIQNVLGQRRSNLFSILYWHKADARMCSPLSARRAKVSSTTESGSWRATDGEHHLYS